MRCTSVVAVVVAVVVVAVVVVVGVVVLIKNHIFFTHKNYEFVTTETDTNMQRQYT